MRGILQGRGPSFDFRSCPANLVGHRVGGGRARLSSLSLTKSAVHLSQPFLSLLITAKIVKRQGPVRNGNGADPSGPIPLTVGLRGDRFGFDSTKLFLSGSPLSVGLLCRLSHSSS